MSFSDYLENELLDHVFGGASYTTPATLYVGLYTSDPADDNSGTELSGDGYARQVITFDAAASGSTFNSDAVEFPTATAAWGVVTHAAVFDAVSGGNMLGHGALTTSKTVETGDIIRIPAGDFNITLD